ncbi:M64 family metallopeptidase [Alteromonas flava]|uniref:M64 family metallopeptidase n=1 Tax=Alteromonas flava TaxID=2048003 RepID=UPI0013DA9625|nr:M64 family metallopeptidase [Alteromonas flava]
MRYALLSGIAGFLLAASDSFDSAHLNDANKVTRNHVQFKRLYQHADVEMAGLRAVAVREGDDYWLQQLAQREDTYSMLILAAQNGDPAERLEWLSRAASLGSAEAQFQLALEVSQSEERVSLLTSSANQAFLPAQHALANWYLMQADIEQAIPWLLKTASHFPDDALSLALLQWQEGEREQAKRWFQQAANADNVAAQRYVSALAEGEQALPELSSNPILFRPLNTQVQTQDKRCSMQILPLALSLSNFVQAKRMIDQLFSDERLQRLPLCVSEPVWMSAQDLPCSDLNSAGRARLVCRLQQLASIIRLTGTTHVVLFTPAARAYVDAGIMYLDSNDTYSVFVHELAHFAGFADEYPMSERIADVHCERQQAPNILFAGELTYQPIARAEYWESLITNNADDQLGIYPARTCANTQVQAYKLTAARTFMEFHDTEYIPDIYLQLWEEQLLQRKHWYPVAINLAREYQQLGRHSEAQEWREIAQQQAQLPPQTVPFASSLEVVPNN